MYEQSVSQMKGSEMWMAEMKSSAKAEIISWIKVILSAVVIAVIVDCFIIANAVVPTGSMETTIPAGSRIMGLRLYYRFAEPKRGDIVIFKYPDDESVDYLKRIIGLPGETVEIIDGKVYINGSDEPLDEPYLSEVPTGDYGPYYARR
jgi:signal peptidase I